MNKITCTCNKQFDTVEECLQWHKEQNKEIMDAKHSFIFKPEDKKNEK